MNLLIDKSHRDEPENSGKEILALDSTTIATWLACKRKYQLSFIENLAPIEEAAFFGSGKLVHTLLEKYYEQRKDRVEIGTAAKVAIEFARGWCSGNPEGTVIPEETWNHVAQRFVEYVAFWSQERLKIVGTEIGFSVPIFDSKQSYFVLEGRLDFLAEDDNGLFWMDHKSMARETEYYGYSPQFLNYSLALGTNHGQLNYFGLQKSAPKKGFFYRTPFKYTKEQLEEWKWELINIFSEIAAARRIGKFRKNRLECKHGLNYKCQFTRICEQTKPGSEQAIKDSYFKVREPWSPWRIGEVHD